MTETKSRFGLLAGMAWAVGCVCLAGCAAPVTRTETSEVTTTQPRALPPPVVITPQQTVVTRTVNRDRNGNVVDEETDETGPAPAVTPPPVIRSTTETTTSGTN
jgi:hypothetical protein